jgi:hypothetical protein
MNWAQARLLNPDPRTLAHADNTVTRAMGNGGVASYGLFGGQDVRARALPLNATPRPPRVSPSVLCLHCSGCRVLISEPRHKRTNV